MLHVLLRGTAFWLLAVGLGAQDWRPIGPAGDGAAAYDWARGEVLTVGGMTFAADGSGWRQCPGSLVPIGGWSLCHDPVRNRTVAINARFNVQTFEWDGVEWLARTSAHTPVFRSSYSGIVPLVATFDSQRQHVLVFSMFNTIGQTWSWDGTDWQLLSSSGPVANGQTGYVCMAFDSARGVAQLIAYGGGGSEFWEWDGVSWGLRSFPIATPSGYAMAYDPVRRRTLVQSLTGTWELDASGAWGVWQQITTTNDYHAPIFFARDRARMVGTNGVSFDEWNGQAWVPYLRREPPTGTRMRLHPASGRVVSFGSVQAGVTMTAVHDGFGWREVFPPVSPSARASHSMWNDGHDVWLFGGQDANSVLVNDTWRWDGTNWTQVSTPQAPSPRVGTAIAYDSTRQRAVAFGGATAVGNQGYASGTAETWEFDGATWLQRSPATTPPARSFAAAGYDPIAARTMVCLGDLATGFRAIDAWQFDGQQWTVAPPVNAYTYWAGQKHDLVFDPVGGRLVLAQEWGDIFAVREFTGNGWVTVPAPPYLRSSQYGIVQLVAEKDGSLLLYGGYRRMVTNSAATKFGAGCVGDLLLSPRTYPKLGAASGIEVVGAPPNGPVLLLAADSTTSIPLGNGCTQLVPHTQWHFFLFADAFGVARLPLTIPDDIALRGYQLNFQALTFAATAPGFAASAGLRLTIGD